MSPDPKSGTEVPQEALDGFRAWLRSPEGATLIQRIDWHDDGAQDELVSKVAALVAAERERGDRWERTATLHYESVKQQQTIIETMGARLSALPDAFRAEFPTGDFPGDRTLSRSAVLRWLEEQTRG